MFVGIVCPNYSGSTVVGGILHRFDSVQHVGEIWKLLSEDKAKSFCFECRPRECTFFSHSFTKRFALTDPNKRIDLLRKHFDSDHIVSGDKGPWFYNKLQVLPDKVLILIKNKYSAAYSYAKRDRRFRNANGSEKAKLLETAAKEYFDILMERISWVKSNFNLEDCVYASTDVLVECSDTQLSSFARLLFDAEMKINETPFDEYFHYIGGNHRLSTGSDPLFFKGKFRADKRFENFFTDEMYYAIDNYIDDKVTFPLIDTSNYRFLESWVIENVNN